MDLSPVVLSIPIYLALILIELIHTFVKKTEYYRVSDAITNISCGIGDQIVGVFAKVVTVGVFQFIHLNFALFQFEPTWYSFLILFVLVDFTYYWIHRLSHEVNFLWAGHVVHHQSEDYNLSVALRQSWFHKFFTFAFYLPLAFFGFDTMSFIWANGLNLLYQFWIHTELIKKLGPLEKVLNTPSHHRVHHGRNPEYIDKNHAGVFIIWDKLFGTFAEEREKPVYGITTPINSWNPLWANVSHWKVMGDQIRQTPNWRDKFLVLVKPPGWRPSYMGGQLEVPAVEAHKYKKYKVKSPKVLMAYTIFQFTTLIGAAAAFLFLGELHLSLAEQALGASLIILGIVNIGMLFSRKRRFYIAEYFRLVTGLVYLAFILQSSKVFAPTLFTVSAITFVSLLWLTLMVRVFKRY